MNDDLRRYHRNLVLVGVLVPVSITLVGFVLSLAWLPRLPAEIAMHWNTAGEVDGYGPPIALSIMTTAIALVMVAVSVGSAWTPASRGRSANSRFLLATSWWLATLLTALQLGTLSPQLNGGESSDSAPLPSGALVLGLLIGVVLGVVAWFVAPRPPVVVESVRTGDERVDLELRPEQRAVWTGSVRAPIWLLAIAGLLTFALTIQAVALLATGYGGVWLLFVACAVLVAAWLSLLWRVRIDSRGVVVRALLGLPRLTIPLDALADASAVDVSPVADFGGYGARWIPGRTGVVVRKGPGIEFERTTGRALVVTVDDAETGAAVARALLAQRQHSSV